MNEKVKCMICGEELNFINNLHLKTHNITVKEYREKFPNAPLLSEGLKKQISETLTGRTKENNESVRRQSEKMIGRTKETHEGVRRQSEKLTGRTKENDEGTRRQADALRGRTKEEYEYIQQQADKLTGRTKEEYDYLKRQSEKMKSRTGELAPQWKGGVSFEPYCPRFDDDLKERVRLFFDRKCYICGKSEQEQIDEMKEEGKVPIRKLDVHHVNYNKDTCCDDSKPCTFM